MYRYSKKEGWVGYCEGCEMPFQPRVINATENIHSNERGAHMKIKWGKTKETFRGFCLGCCNIDGSGGYAILNHIVAERLSPIVVGGVEVI